MTPAGARLILDAARSACAAAEELHLVATREEGAAVVALSEAQTAYEDAPSNAAGGAWHRAREARELAALRTNGAARRLEDARAAAVVAEQADARARLADALARADRGKLFADLADTILDCAAIDAVAPIDPHAPVGEDVIAVRLGCQAERFALRALRCRSIRRVVEAQHVAVADARTAAGELGQSLPRTFKEIPEAHVIGSIALELQALGPAPLEIGARDRWVTSWLADYFDGGNHALSSNAVSHARDIVAGKGVYAHNAQTWPLWLAWLRGVVLTGDTTARCMVPVEGSASNMAPPASAPPPAPPRETSRLERALPQPRTPSFSI